MVVVTSTFAWLRNSYHLKSLLHELIASCMCSKCLWYSSRHFIKPLNQWLIFLKEFSLYWVFSLQKVIFWQNIQSANPLGWSTLLNESPHLGPCASPIPYMIRISVDPLFGHICSSLFLGRGLINKLFQIYIKSPLWCFLNCVKLVAFLCVFKCMLKLTARRWCNFIGCT